MNPEPHDVSSNGPPLPDTAEELLPLGYEELRRMAAQRMAREAPGQTLQATALVHEAWIKLGDGQFENRAHFFAAAAEAMRRILVDNARPKQSVKHGGALQRADWSSLDLAAEAPDEQVLAVDEALDRLAQRDPLGAELINTAILRRPAECGGCGVARHFLTHRQAHPGLCPGMAFRRVEPEILIRRQPPQFSQRNLAQCELAIRMTSWKQLAPKKHHENLLQIQK